MEGKIVPLKFDLRHTVHMHHGLGHSKTFPFEQGTLIYIDFQLCPHPIYEPTDEILQEFPDANWTAMIYPNGEEINRGGDTEMIIKPLDFQSKAPVEDLSYVIDHENHLYAFLTRDDDISKPFDLDFLSWAVVRIPTVVELVSQREILDNIHHTASIAPHGDRIGEFVVITEVEYLKMAF
jgi:hypothetical protein